MIFLSLRVTADAEGGLKGPARLRRSLRGLGGVSHQQASAGIYRRIACCCYQDRFLLLPTSFLCYSFYFRCFWSPVKRQITWSSMIMIGLLVLITLARRWPDLCRGYTTATAPLVS